MRRPLIIAHRGASAYEKENTLAAFLLAEKMGADRVEMDVWATLDKVFIVQHSRRVRGLRRRRGKRGKRWVDQLTLAQIRKLTNQCLTLEKVLDRLVDSKLGLEIDLKNTGAENELVRLIKKKKIGKLTFKSNNGWQLAKLKNLMPFCQTVLYYERTDKWDVESRRWVKMIIFGIGFILSLPIKKILPRFLGRTITFGADGVSLYHRFCNQKMVEDLHHEGVKVYIWGLEKERHIKKVLKWRVDGMISKRPDMVRKFLISNF